ncbi:DUF4258 domain-containing protein [Rubrobacter aplysinae]|uniref:DUF4258 domain-containing protein n=1 Tax=Rubrobacter aplysinae TaxID=909625 RepID=UPI0009FF18B3
MAYERLSYTRHALIRMEERGVQESDVLRVLNNPDLTYPSYGKRVSEDVFEGGRLLRIVFVDTLETETDARIVSAIDLEEGQAREVRVR